MRINGENAGITGASGTTAVKELLFGLKLRRLSELRGFMYPNKKLLTTAFVTALTVASLPLFSCIDDPPTHPEIIDYQSYIEMVWELYDQKYVAFDEKAVDWDALLDEYMQLAENVASYDEMSDLLAEMVGKLEDKNSWFLASSQGIIPIYSPDIEINWVDSVLMNLLEPWDFQWDTNYTVGVMWGHCVIDSVPYFAIRHFNYYFTYQGFRDEIQSNLRAPGMIIDIRMSDDVSLTPVLQIPSVFADQPREAFLTQHRTGPEHCDLSQLSAYSISPVGLTFTKPVVLLVGEQNIGPAEAFASVMGQMPHVTIIGDTTGGGGNTPGFFSQINWPLWEDRYITCPFARVFTADTVSIEGNGILPDIYVQTTPADFLDGHDPVLEYAIEWIGEATSPM